jgi:hypothetical protein
MKITFMYNFFKIFMINPSSRIDINNFSRKNGKLLVLLFNMISIMTIRSGKYTPYVVLISFLILLLFYPIIKNKIIIFYFSLFSVTFFYGILNFNSFYSILEDIFAFLPLLLIFIHRSKLGTDLNKNLHIYLANSFVYLIPISGLIFKFMDYGFGSIMTTRFNYDESTNFELFAPIFPISIAPFLVFYFDKYNLKQKFLINFANILIFLMGIITLSRSVVLGAFLPYFIMYIYKLSKLKINISKLLFTLILVISSLLYFANSKFYTNSVLSIAVEGVQIRNERGYESSDVTSGRFVETQDYLEQNLNIITFLIGKGLGGHKTENDSDSYIGGVNMIHFGPIHAFMKGGILLVIFLYFPLLYSIYFFWNTRYNHFSLIMILFLLNNIQTSNWGWGYGTLFYWMIISKLIENITSKKAD